MSSHVRLSDGITPPPGPLPAHEHPLNTFLAVVLVVDLVLVLVLGVFTIREVITAGQRAERQAEQVRTDVLAEINRRSAARDAQQREQQAQTNAIVCQVLTDLPQTPSVATLEVRLRCPGSTPGSG